MTAIQKIDLYEVGYPDIVYKVADIDPSKAFGSDNGGHALGGSIAEGQPSKGQNALFGDGHVTFGKPPKDASGVQYRIRQENENLGTVNGVSNASQRYFYYLNP